MEHEEGREGGRFPVRLALRHSVCFGEIRRESREGGKPSAVGDVHRGFPRGDRRDDRERRQRGGFTCARKLRFLPRRGEEQHHAPLDQQVCRHVERGGAHFRFGHHRLPLCGPADVRCRDQERPESEGCRRRCAQSGGAARLRPCQLLPQDAYQAGGRCRYPA